MSESRKINITKAEIKKLLAIIKSYQETEVFDNDKYSSRYLDVGVYSGNYDPDRFNNKLFPYIDYAKAAAESRPELQVMCEALILLHGNPAALTQEHFDALDSASRGDPHRTLGLIVSDDDRISMKRMINAKILVPDDSAAGKYRFNPLFEKLASSPLAYVKETAEEEKKARESIDPPQESSQDSVREPISPKNTVYEPRLDPFLLLSMKRERTENARKLEEIRQSKAAAAHEFIEEQRATLTISPGLAEVVKEDYFRHELDRELKHQRQLQQEKDRTSGRGGRW